MSECLNCTKEIIRREKERGFEYARRKQKCTLKQKKKQKTVYN